jgi:hypothetical protein
MAGQMRNLVVGSFEVVGYDVSQFRLEQGHWGD